MKALVINGSPHKNGATAMSLEMVIAAIKDSYDYELIHAYDCTVRPCVGCSKCRPDKTCILPRDDGHLIGEKLKEADLLVLGTPSYWSSMPSPLKAIFDRNVAVLEYCLDKPPVPNMTGKKAVVVVTCASDGCRSEDPNQFPLLIANISNILQSSGYEIADTLKVHSSWNFEQSRDLLRESIIKLNV